MTARPSRRPRVLAAIEILFIAQSRQRGGQVLDDDGCPPIRG